MSLTVGKDGKITDNIIAATNGSSGFGIIVPAKVILVKEGAGDLLSWKTDAFYGNLLAGFKVQMFLSMISGASRFLRFRVLA